MDPLSLALITGLGWTSGIRFYAVLFLLGILHRSELHMLPASLEVLAHPWVIATSCAVSCGSSGVANSWCPSVPRSSSALSCTTSRSSCIASRSSRSWSARLRRVDVEVLRKRLADRCRSVRLRVALKLEDGLLHLGELVADLV